MKRTLDNHANAREDTRSPRKYFKRKGLARHIVVGHATCGWRDARRCLWHFKEQVGVCSILFEHAALPADPFLLVECTTTSVIH